MKKFYCDMCGKQIGKTTPNLASVNGYLVNVKSDGINDRYNHQYEICPVCASSMAEKYYENKKKLDKQKEDE